MSPAGPDASRDRGTDVGLLLLTVIWGVNFSVIKVALEALDPLAFNALRFVLASAVLYGFVRVGGGVALPDRGDVPRVLLLGVVGNVVYQPLFILGLDATLAGNAAVLLATTPVWTALLATLAGEERLAAVVWIGAVATVAGMTLVVLGGRQDVALGGSTLRGDLLMIAAAVVWSLYTVGARSLTVRYGSLPVTAWTLWVGTVGLVLMGVVPLARTELSAVPAGAWLAVVYAGALALAVAYALWYRGVRVLGSSRTAVFSNLVPVVALVTAWIWLGETPSLVQGLGAGIVIAGVSLARLPRRRSMPAPE